MSGLECPYCRSGKVKRNGYTIKGFKRFFCYLCRKYWQDIYVRKVTDLSQEQKQLLLWAKQHSQFRPYLISALPIDPFFSNNKEYNLLFAYPNLELGCHGLWIQLTCQLATSLDSLLDPWLERIKQAGYAVKVVANCQEAVFSIESYMRNVLG